MFLLLLSAQLSKNQDVIYNEEEFSSFQNLLDDSTDKCENRIRTWYWIANLTYRDILRDDFTVPPTRL